MWILILRTVFLLVRFVSRIITLVLRPSRSAAQWAYKSYKQQWRILTLQNSALSVAAQKNWNKTLFQENSARRDTVLWECLMPLCEAGDYKELFCRKCAVFEELCCRWSYRKKWAGSAVFEWMRKRQINYFQQCYGLRLPGVLNLHCGEEADGLRALQGNYQRTVSQGSDKDEGWRHITACTTRRFLFLWIWQVGLLPFPAGMGLWI